MAQKEIICLANSRKHGGRCVAGLHTNGGGWLRAVGRVPDGTLFPPDYTLTDGSEPRLLDVIRIGLEKPQPSLHQPENWTIDGSRWQLVARPAASELAALLHA